VFHGLLDRQQNARLLHSAKIGINPHDLSDVPGNVFAFKIIEYLAAGAHVITTPMGVVEPELETGITYMPDNSPETIATTLRQVIADRRYEQTAAEAAWRTYSLDAVSESLDELFNQVCRPFPTAARSVGDGHTALRNQTR
jgi:glycosyltransferase involved in cell wall biosynthesis